ncbi:hypothetical protein [Streptomyces aidingensis]|uniref:hypothetical protein n=1 Tax=Streptomyces aidingensis TaxID=910347 RepID=UPI000B81A198|nr:hypothetical protein [Streptomyces aidingensis]
MTVPRIVVYPPTPGGGRRVRVDREILGIARSTGELVEFLRRAGADPESIDITDPAVVEWRGPGPEVWAE